MPNSQNGNLGWFLALGASVGVLGALGLAKLLDNSDRESRADRLPNQDPNPESLIQFKTAMHAFMSLVSMEKTGCELLSASDPGCYQCLTENFDPGWDPKQFHRFFQLLASSTTGLSKNASQLLALWNNHSMVCMDFFSSKSPAQDHRNLINNRFKKTDVVLYPWGADNHRVYIELWRKEADCYRIMIFDLGAGRAFRRAHYKPILFDNLTRAEFSAKVLQFIENYKASTDLRFLLNAFDTEEAVCTACIPEYAQQTGNCVVKNFLAAMQQDAIDRYGASGLDVFSELYVSILGACLREAEKHASRQLVTQLPSFATLCNVIERSQIAFTGTSKMKLRPIAEQYERVRAISARVAYNPSVLTGVCRMETASVSQFFANKAKLDRDTANRNSKVRKEKQRIKSAIEGATRRTEDRMARFPGAPYELMSTRDLADYFPELGRTILQSSNIEHTDTNKTLFINKETGWYICYDKRGDYNTVHDAYDRYVALDGATSGNGADAKFHFYNTIRSRDAAFSRAFSNTCPPGI